HTRWPRDWSSDVCSSDLLLQVAVDVGSGQRENQRAAGVRLAETLYRRQAAPRMQRNQQVAFFAVPVLLDADFVPQFSEQPCPAVRGRAVSGVDLGGCWRDGPDLHSSL